MEEDEAKVISKAMKTVAEHYDVLPGMSDKAAAWANLSMVLGMAYGPRIMAYRLRQKNDAREAGHGTV